MKKLLFKPHRMRKIIAGIIALSLYQSATAQFDYSTVSHSNKLSLAERGLLSVSEKGLMPKDFRNIYSDIKGNAFFSQDWMMASAVNQRNVKYTGLKALFDVYKNNFYINVNDTIYNTGPTIVRFECYPNENDTTKKFIFSRQFTLPDPAAGKYVQVLSEGKFSFVKYVAREVVEQNTGMYSEKEKMFLDKIYYYVIASSGQPLELTKLNKKNLQKALSDKWDAVQKFASQDRDLSFSKEDDWKKIIDYYNTL
jgi:hypothetical protein